MMFSGFTEDVKKFSAGRRTSQSNAQWRNHYPYSLLKPPAELQYTKVNKEDQADEG